jgi:eukaryotic-like serine/threonine-protein kinase
MVDEHPAIRDINEDARRRFEQFWADGTPHPIEEFLPDESQQSYLPTLEELVLIDLEFSWRTWSSRQAETGKMEGETIVGPPHAETYVARFVALQDPQVVRRLVLEEISLRNRYGPPPNPDEYRERFPDVELSETVFAAKSEHAEDKALVGARSSGKLAAEETLPRQFGPYQLTERIGAGGMGVVYRAWQEGVDREIAVKILRTDRLADLTTDHRQVLIDRFGNEARATARIDHPQIVTVYDVGEEDGVPYYTMQYVAGRSLGDALQELPVPEREAARIIQIVATAVQAAHDHGVLHRDLKPHNVIIEESSHAPFVADFGLAKLLEDNASQTVTGEILGTPQYMSPEQAQDSGSVTTRSDVYALGATLYYLLTGQPPFTGRNHLEILKQVLDKDPASPRQLNPAIDADLEVICLKCLEKDPEQRYSSARALADDLWCWLNGDPIAARPPGRWERVRRWRRKNPLSSSLAALAALSVVFGFVALGAGYAQATAALEDAKVARDDAEVARDDAEVARDDAESKYQHAHGTVNEFFAMASENVVLNQPRLQPLRRELLRRARMHYDEFLRTRKDDPALNAELALTHFRVGDITEELDSSDQALASYEQAVAMQRRLHREQPGDADITRDLSASLNAMGACLTRLDRADEALTALHEARTLRQSLVDANENNVEYRRLLASTVMNIGSLHRSESQFDEARRHYDESIDMRSELLNATQPEPRKVARDQGMAYFNLGNLECDQVFLATTVDNAGMLASAAGHLEQAFGHLTRVAQQAPDDFEVREKAVLCSLVLGEVRIKQQNFVSAEAAYATAVELMRDLAAENPRVPQYQVELARDLQMMGQCMTLQGDWERALGLYLECCERLRAVLEGDNSTPQATSDLVQALHGLALVHLQREERPLALETAQEALEYAGQLTAQDPANGWYAQQLRDVRKFIDVVEATDQ